MQSRRWRWRAWRARSWLLGGVRALVYALGFAVSLLAGNVPLPNDGPKDRPRVNVVDRLSAPRLDVSDGWLGRVARWAEGDEVRGRLTVDPASDVFLWEAVGRDGSAGPVARVIAPLAGVRVADRWAYGFGRKTVVVALAGGATLWLTGRKDDASLRMLR